MKSEYLILAEFDDISDLYFLEQELRDKRIICNIVDDKTNPRIKKVKVKNNEFREAKLILNKLGYKKSNRTSKQPRPEDVALISCFP